MENLSIRSAVYSDVLDILKWRNHPLVRDGAVNQDEISVTDHTQWFYERMKNNEIYIFEKDGQKAGVVSFRQDAIDGVWSFYLNPDFIGKKLGRTIMMMGLEIAKFKGYFQLIACVKSTNRISLKLHQELGFQVEGCKDDLILFFKRLEKNG